MSDEPAEGSLPALRARIDAIDHAIIELLAQRMAIVRELSAVKRAEGRRVRDPERERAVLEDRTRHGELRQLPPELIESLFRVVLRGSREYQAALKVELPVQNEQDPKTVAIVGGRGGMGKRLAELFRVLGHRVLIADLGTELSPIEAAKAAQVTIISVPISATLQVIDELGPHVPADGLLMDVTSLKQAPLARMLAACSASVLGTHPMFGPGVHTFQGQRVVLCPGRGEAWLRWVERALQASGLVTTHSSAEEHDRAMALVQVLTHFQTQVLGLTLAELGRPLAESLRFTSPAYLIELYVAARHFAQDPALYGPIEMENPLTPEVTQAFTRAAERLRSLLRQRDQAGFAGVFAEVRAFFGEFSSEATIQGDYLIDRLIERS
jgi:chorismate mutase/prephenate dehydrogenase